MIRTSPLSPDLNYLPAMQSDILVLLVLMLWPQQMLFFIIVWISRAVGISAFQRVFWKMFFKTKRKMFSGSSNV